MRKHIRNFFNGVAFGITETVPGISGGTIAIILGFYDELIKTINHFRIDYRKSFKFVIPLILGAAAGILTFSSIMHYLLTNHSLPTMAFFIGLIVGIIPLIYLKIKEPGRSLGFKKLTLILLPILMLVLVAHLKGVSVTDPQAIVNSIDLSFMLFIFIAGIVAAAALVIPGVSGSFVLLLLGIYPLVTYSISSIRHLLADISNISLLWDIGKVLGPLAIGIVIGGLTMVKLIEKLLKNYYTNIYSIILGLLIGSVYALFKEPIVFQSGTSTLIIMIAITTFLLGCIASFTIGKRRL